jgi:prevent-host-death family protein
MWKLQDAKAKFSQLVEDALKIGPQYVTRRGKKTVVVLSAEKYEKLISKKPSFKNFLLSCPKIGDDFDLTRQKDIPRSMDL